MVGDTESSVGHDASISLALLAADEGSGQLDQFGCRFARIGDAGDGDERGRIRRLVAACARSIQALQEVLGVAVNLLKRRLDP